MEAYNSAFLQLDVVLALGQSLTKRHDRLVFDDDLEDTRDLGSEAATWAIQRGKLDRAVEFLEQGRSLLLAQIGRYRVKIDDIRQVDPDLANRFADLSRRLDASVVSDQQIKEGGSTTKDPYGRSVSSFCTYYPSCCRTHG